MELVTGRAGSPHITSQQDRQKHQGIWGDGAYILATGNQLEPEVQSSNKILIKDGALMFQGALFSVKVGTTDEITINNGNQGMQRKDLVVARYIYDSAQQIESAEWVVIQGEPAASNPVAPSGTSGDIQTGDTTVDCPFMIVNLDGINVTGVDIIPEKIPTLPELIGNLKSQNVIWTGSTYLGGDQTVRLSEKISDQKSGICLIWRRYNPGEGAVTGLCYSFIPKYALTFGSEMTHTVWITNYTGGYAATKTFYLSDSEITGHASNETGSTIQGTSGITTNNNRFALVGVVGC